MDHQIWRSLCIFTYLLVFRYGLSYKSVINSTFPLLPLHYLTSCALLEWKDNTYVDDLKASVGISKFLFLLECLAFLLMGMKDRKGVNYLSALD